MSRRRRGGTRRGIYVLPSLLTTGNLFAGYYSIVSALNHEFRGAAIALGIAFILDGLDGRIARMTNTQSDFGKIYDSLADVLTFGAAPAVLMLSWGFEGLGRVGWLTSFFFLVCAAVRLARFSVASGRADYRFFVGIPSPAAACLFAALAFYYPQQLDALWLRRGLLALVVVVSLLMISSVRYRSFKDFDLRRRQPYTVIVILATVITLIALDPERVLLMLAVGYAFSGPIERVASRFRHQQPEETASGATEEHP